LSLFVLNDNNFREHGWYITSAVVVGLLLIAGAVVEWRRHGRARGLIWAAALVGLPILAASVSLVASERYATYRTIFAMTAVLLCFMVASARALTAHWSASGRRLLATVVVGVAFCTAQHHVYALIAVPQGNEWQLILSGAKHVHLNGSARQRIFAIASSPSDISTASIYHDEFGSLSSNSEWVPREMFKRAMHDLHPEIANLDARYDFSSGPRLPVDQRFNVIIDLHRLRQFHTDNGALRPGNGTPAVGMRGLGRLDGRHIESRHHRIEHFVGRPVHACISQQQAGQRPGAAAADIRRHRRGSVLSDAHTMALSVEAHAMDCGRRRARVFRTRPYFR